MVKASSAPRVGIAVRRVAHRIGVLPAEAEHALLIGCGGFLAVLHRSEPLIARPPCHLEGGMRLLGDVVTDGVQGVCAAYAEKEDDGGQGGAPRSDT